MGATTESPPNGQKMSRDEIIAKLSPYPYPVEWFDHVRDMNIHQRLHGAMADLGPMKKDGFAKVTSEGGFRYHGHAEITAHVKAALEKWRIMIGANVLEEQHEPVTVGKFKTPGWLTTVKVLVRFANIDNPSDYVESLHVGYGIDTSDKGSGKAVTYATKYAMLKQFMISDGEEPDNEAFNWAEHDAEQERERLREPRNAKTRQEVARAALDNAEQGAGHKAASTMTHGELLAQIFAEVEDMGRDRAVVKAYLKEHDGATKPADVPKDRLISLWQSMRAKRLALDQCREMVAAASDRENAEAMLAGIMDGRCIFEIDAQDFYGLARRLEELGQAV